MQDINFSLYKYNLGGIFLYPWMYLLIFLNIENFHIEFGFIFWKKKYLDYLHYNTKSAIYIKYIHLILYTTINDDYNRYYSL